MNILDVSWKTPVFPFENYTPNLWYRNIMVSMIGEVETSKYIQRTEKTKKTTSLELWLE